MVTSYSPGPETDPLAPGEGMQPDVTRDHGDVEVMPPLRLDVHVAAENLGENG